MAQRKFRRYASARFIVYIRRETRERGKENEEKKNEGAHARARTGAELEISSKSRSGRLARSSCSLSLSFSFPLASERTAAVYRDGAADASALSFITLRWRATSDAPAAAAVALLPEFFVISRGGLLLYEKNKPAVRLLSTRAMCFIGDF